MGRHIMTYKLKHARIWTPTRMASSSRMSFPIHPNKIEKHKHPEWIYTKNPCYWGSVFLLSASARTHIPRQALHPSRSSLWNLEGSAFAEGSAASESQVKHNLSIACKTPFEKWLTVKKKLPILDTWWPYTLEEQNDISSEFLKVIDITDIQLKNFIQTDIETCRTCNIDLSNTSLIFVQHMFHNLYINVAK